MAPDDNANSKGATFFSILPFGVVLVTNPTADDGDVCPFCQTINLIIHHYIRHVHISS